MDPILKIEEERARFEADAVPYGFDIARSKNIRARGLASLEAGAAA